MARRGLTLSVLGVGVLLIGAARLILPAAPPLYDGIVPIDPYRWLDPPAGHPGDPKGATAQIPVRSGKSPLVAVATPELDPQAQIFAQPDGLTVTPGARTIKVSIVPIAAEGAPADGHIDGNVYRINVVDDTGAALTAPASARVSVVLRATDPAQAVATVERFSGGAWQPLKTSSSGFGGSFLAVVTAFGDFAVVIPGPGPGSAASSGPATSLGASIAATAQAVASLGSSPASNAPIPPGDTSDLTPFVVGGLVLAALVLGSAGYGLARRRRRRRYRGAHPIKRR